MPIHQHLDNLQKPPEKFNPKAGIKYVPFEKEIVTFTDKLLEIANKNGSMNTVNHESDWKTVEFMYRGFKILYPQDAGYFEKSVDFYRTAETFNKGVVKGEHGAILHHMIDLPSPFYRMMKVIFPMQVWDKKFVNKFIRHMPQMNIHI
jgi:hypothetical protein